MIANNDLASVGAGLDQGGGRIAEICARERLDRNLFVSRPVSI
ncbi:hypothetical protein [Phenylobacterium sp.]|nr:hypothetical protein [Phenylobacterium sp.]